MDVMRKPPDAAVAPRGAAAAAAGWPAFAAIFVVALLPLLATPVLPFIDLYNHLARYFVLAHLAGDPALQQNYASNWGLLPNIGLDVIGTLLLGVVPPRLIAHVVVALVLAVEFAGVLAFNRAVTGRASLFVAVLLVPLLYSFILNWGFANFLLGLGLVFAAAAWWLRWRTRLAVGLPVACLAAVAIFLTHGLAFALYGVLVASLEVGLWWQRPGRRVGRLAAALVPVAAQAVVPVALFLAGGVAHKAQGMTNADTAVTRLAAAGRLGGRLWQLLCHRATTIVRVAEGPSLTFDLIGFVVVLAVLAALLWRRQVRVAGVAVPALAAAAVLVAVTPPMLFGVGYVADRMPLFFALLFVGSLAAPRDVPWLRPATLLLAALVAVRLAAIAADWRAYARLSDEFAAVAAKLVPGELIELLVVGGQPRDATDLRYAMFGPLAISRYGEVGPLFADAAEQPLRLIGPLARAVAALPRESSAGDMPMAAYDDRLAAMGPAGFRYVLVTHADRLTRPLPAGVTVAARSPHFALLRFG